MTEAATKSPSTGATESPYVAGRREWNERYGDYIAQTHNAQRISWMALLVGLVCAGGMVYSASQNKYIPYLIEADRFSQVQARGVAQQAGPVEDRFKKALLAEFIESLRGVLVDGHAQRQKVYKAYAMLRKTDAATGMVSAHFQNESPFDRAITETVTVQIETILPLTDRTWQIEWRETVRDRSGAETGAQEWTATANVIVVPPSDEATILKNPLGLYVTELSWSQRM